MGKTRFQYGMKAMGFVTLLTCIIFTLVKSQVRIDQYEKRIELLERRLEFVNEIQELETRQPAINERYGPSHPLSKGLLFRIEELKRLTNYVEYETDGIMWRRLPGYGMKSTAIVIPDNASRERTGGSIWGYLCKLMENAKNVLF